jgi:pyruvate,orthophosphate dikinase
MIIAGNEQERRRALDRLLPYQKQDFIGIFEAMEGLPVTIRLLDPPLHEFLPQEEYEIEAVARELETEPARLKAKVNQLKEFNPMLGHRGCRLGIVFPEITEMQARAILEAALELSGDGKMVIPEIMVPLVGTPEEFRHQRSIIDQTARELFKAAGREVSYEVGTMIEIPRACLLADQIARDADFFSFGTNDLTQMTYGYSRDDATKFLPYYLEENILPDDPFQVLDSEGVGQLVEMATRKGRTVKPGLKVGICGEHGGEPASIAFCYNLDLNYVSCSPYRVPVARLAVAQSRIRSMANHKSMSSGQAALTEDAANFTVG